MGWTTIALVTTLLTRIKSAWPPRKVPEPTYVDDRLNHWAEARPRDPAFTYGARSWTWAEAHDRVHRLAFGLREHGVARGDVVAYVGSGHQAGVELTLAAGSIGAATALLDGGWDIAAVGGLLAELDARVVVVDAALGEDVDAVRSRVMRVVAVTRAGGDTDDYETLIAASTPCADGPDVVEDDVCLVLYPKGAGGDAVRLTHRDVVTGAVGVEAPVLETIGRINEGTHTAF